MDNSLEKIYKAGLKFLAPLTPEETYRVIVQEAVKLVKGEVGALSLMVEGEFKIVYRQAPPGSPPPAAIRKAGFAYKSFKEGKVLVIDSKRLKKAHPEVVREEFRSNIFIPLAYKGKSLGVLAVRFHSKGNFTQNEPEILKLFGSMASLAIRKTQLYDETQKALESRDLFLSMAAHEFRTPLTTISGYVQLLANKFTKDENPQSRWIEELSWETRRLTYLVNELLEISRIKGGKLHFVWRECFLPEIIERAAREFKFNHPGRKLNIQNILKKDSLLVVGDFDKLLQVITNLLDNAAKFSTFNKDILVKLTENHSEFIITVKDSGKGIETKDLPKIFEGFYQGHKSTDQGMGLGLFLAKIIIEQHHGSINVRSRLGKGTRVDVTLPKVKI